ncbi:ImmA/IrrE family metallo-endopeptidase [Streptomyces abyssalis]|uniref:ImmA/IrrE family metallo-endopeptidase n=1 Tax=Streptomyces abyssalis TaxID=933944 RepID=UPI00085C8F41|nr:ImmA/IrrE family metallo-endopeptidase [Streptomyces abyssalis]
MRDLGLPPAESIRELLPAIESRSGRSIRLEPAPLNSGDGLCGMWIRTAEGIDYIFVNEETSRAHQDHIIAHEAAHILRNHQGGRALGDVNPVTDRLVTTLDPGVVKMMLGRSDYEFHDEREAELIASHLQRHIHHPGPDIGGDDRIAETLLRRRRQR